jgi:hypothetical protein
MANRSTKTFIVSAIALLTLCVALSSCGHRNEKAPENIMTPNMRQQIIGIWAADELLTPDHKRMTSVKTTNSFSPDGIYSFISSKSEDGAAKLFSTGGTWRLTNEDLILTATNGNEPDLHSSNTAGLAHIVRLTTNNLIYKLDGGPTISFVRLK